MDRFIDIIFNENVFENVNLKSNMDRFIALSV